MKGSLRHGYGVRVKRIYLYNAWISIKQQCYNKNYSRYIGNTGIKVYEPWINNFIAFHDWAMQNGWKTGLLLDRKDKDKDFCPDNIYWKKDTTNNYKKIKYNGKTQSLLKWSRELNFSYNVALKRLNKGWSIQDAFFTPIMRNRKKSKNIELAMKDYIPKHKTSDKTGGAYKMKDAFLDKLKRTNISNLLKKQVSGSMKYGRAQTKKADRL